MDTYKEPKVGDWVRFLECGSHLVIGVVTYIKDQDRRPWGIELCTDIGEMPLSEVLEAR